MCIDLMIVCDLTNNFLEASRTCPLQGVVKKPRMSCLTAAGPTVTSRGKCCTHTAATFEDAQGLSIMKVFFSPHFHSLPLEQWPWYFKKNLVILGWAQFLQIFWVSCVVTGTGVVGRGVFPECNNRRPRALPDLLVQLPVLLTLPSWVTWHPPVSANDPPPPSSPTHGRFQYSGLLPQSFSAVCWKWGGRLWCISESPIWSVLKTHVPGSHSRAPESEAGVGEALKQLLGWSRSDKHSHCHPACRWRS